MTIYLNPNSISGVSSVTAAASPDPTAAVKFYNSQGTETLGNPIVSNLTASSINGGQLAGMRNRIINGDMRISQRGTSFSTIVGGVYTLDRWLWSNVGAMVCTMSQSTDIPNNTFQNSYKVDVTTVDTSIGADDYAVILQRIEGYNVRDLIGTTFTLSFWVKSSKTGTHCVVFRNVGTGSPVIPDRSYIKEYTIVAANTWEYKTITVTGGLITAGTWNWTNGTGMDVIFTLATGTTYQTTADAWQTGNFLGTANQVNVMDNVANDFFLTGVQLEPGTVSTPFERRFYGQELALCQRYYEVLSGRVVTSSKSGIGDYISWQYKVTKRATPTVTSGSGSSWMQVDTNSVSHFNVLSYNGTAGVIADSTSSAEL